jgi:hypothetical protein
VLQNVELQNGKLQNGEKYNGELQKIKLPKVHRITKWRKNIRSNYRTVKITKRQKLKKGKIQYKTSNLTEQRKTERQILQKVYTRVCMYTRRCAAKNIKVTYPGNAICPCQRMTQNKSVPGRV